MDLAKFCNEDFGRGASRGKELLWILIRKFFFENSVLPTYSLRCRLLRAFGAEIGKGVVIKPAAKITFPWRLAVRDNAWIGEESWLLNLAQITIGANVCISQRAFLCSGSHDWTSPIFDLTAKSITVEDGAWVGANVFVGPGIIIGRNAVVTAGSVVTEDLPSNMICSGNPCKPVKERVIRER